MQELKWACDLDLPQMYKKHREDAGYDICCAEDTIIPPFPDWVTVKTGLYVSIPRGCVGIIKPRSGMSVKFGTSIGAGVIDSGYLGEVLVMVSIPTDKSLELHAGDRIAQLLVLELYKGPAVRVTPEQLGASDRGIAGFGSTGGMPS